MTRDAPTLPDGYMADSKGRLVPIAIVKPADLLVDQTVRKIAGFADALSAQIARFRGHCYDDIAACVSLICEQYGASAGGAKGNVQLTSYDGCIKVQISVSDNLEFGPELIAAKALVDRCLNEWSDGIRPEMRAIIDHAFQAGSDGRLNREALLRLRRLEIDHETWKQAMAALSDSIRIVGSKEYLRIYRRDSPREAFQPVSLDIATARPPARKEEP